MGINREAICKACDGLGLLEDENQWKYTCTVCNGTGKVMPGQSTSPSKPFAVDETNRTLE